MNSKTVERDEYYLERLLYRSSDAKLLRRFFRENFGFEVHSIPGENLSEIPWLGYRQGTTYGVNNPVSLAWRIIYERAREMKIPVQLYLPRLEPKYIMFINGEREYHTNKEVVKFEKQVIDTLKLLRERNPEFGNEEQIRAMNFLGSQAIEDYVLQYWKNHILI